MTPAASPYVEVLPDHTATTTVGLLARAVTWFSKRGVTVQRIVTDNGPNCRSKLNAHTVSRREIKHMFTRPYRPRTNGKAERFIQSLLREWAYAVAYQTSGHHALALAPWLDFYNHRRPAPSVTKHRPATYQRRPEQPGCDLQ